MLPWLARLGRRKKRRFLSRSDEEIMEEIDTRNKYRYGFPSPIPLLPVDTYPSLWWNEFARRHLRRVRTILRSQRVDIENVRVMLRANGEEEEAVPTLCVSAKEAKGNWFHAIKEIRKHLLSVNLADLAIEIFDSRIFDDLHTFTISAAEAGTIWQWHTHCQPRVLELLHSNIPGVRWATLNVFHRGVGNTRAECFPTVLLSVPNPFNPVWQEEVYPRLVAICWQHFRVEILYYRGTMIADDQAEIVSVEDVNSSSVRMGSSCGPTGVESSGTLGGALELWKDANVIGTFGLTNTHVIHNQAYEEAVEKNSALRPEDAFSREELSYVSSPSTQDTNATLRILKQRIDTRKQHIDGAPGQDGQLESLGLRAQVEMGAESKRRHLEKIERQLREEQTEYDTISNADRCVGPVYAASGFRTVEREIHGREAAWALEWALVNLKRKTLSNAIPLKGKGKEFIDWFGDQPADSWLPSIRPGMTVAKRGRTSGWTIGDVNGIETNMGEVVTGNYGKNIACFAVRSHSQHQYFATSGDSGAVVLEYDGLKPENIKWVGLLFAQDGNRVGYITPIDLVFEDIKMVTGCDAVRPAAVDEP